MGLSLYAAHLWFCCRQGLQEADAADVSQEVMRAVVRAMETFECDPQRGKFRNWLLTVVRSKMNNLLARRQRQPEPSGQSTVAALVDQQASPGNFFITNSREFKNQMPSMKPHRNSPCPVIRTPSKITTATFSLLFDGDRGTGNPPRHLSDSPQWSIRFACCTRPRRTRTGVPRACDDESSRQREAQNLALTISFRVEEGWVPTITKLCVCQNPPNFSGRLVPNESPMKTKMNRPRFGGWHILLAAPSGIGLRAYDLCFWCEEIVAVRILEKTGQFTRAGDPSDINDRGETRHRLWDTSLRDAYYRYFEVSDRIAARNADYAASIGQLQANSLLLTTGGDGIGIPACLLACDVVEYGNAIYVDSVGGKSSNQGSRNEPLDTLPNGVVKASALCASTPLVAVQPGSYAGPMTLSLPAFIVTDVCGSVLICSQNIRIPICGYGSVIQPLEAHSSNCPMTFASPRLPTQ